MNPLRVLPRTPQAWQTTVESPAGPSAERPPVPSLLATRLQLELLLADRSIDLNVAAGIILNDVGATLEIFRRAGEEGDRADRVEHCLASLSTETWMEAVCGNAVERVAAESGRLLELTTFWEHARLLAYACWFVAGHMDGVCPEEAYLVGLFHEVERLPVLLGWVPFERPRRAWSGLAAVHERPAPWAAFQPDPRSDPQSSSRSSSRSDPRAARTADGEPRPTCAAALITYWHLPDYLSRALSAPTARWLAVLNLAHAWSRGEQWLLRSTA